MSVADDAKQAEFIIEHVLAAREARVELKPQAVLFRTSSHSALLELELTRRNIPYVKHGGLSFLEALHVKDLLVMVRWIDNPKHKISAFRLLKLLAGISPRTAECIYNEMSENEFRFRTLT